MEVYGVLIGVEWFVEGCGVEEEEGKGCAEPKISQD